MTIDSCALRVRVGVARHIPFSALFIFCQREHLYGILVTVYDVRVCAAVRRQRAWLLGCCYNCLPKDGCVEGRHPASVLPKQYM